MKTGYTIYRPDGTEEHCEVDWPEDVSLAQIKALVEPIVGAPMEHVTVFPDGDHRDMFVDEMGHMRHEPAVRNHKATDIYRARWLKTHPDTHPEDLPWIAGTAVVFDRTIWT